MTKTHTSKDAAQLGKVLADARKAGGVNVPTDMSVRELAKRSGVSPAQITRIEAGKVGRPRRDILVALARALNRNPLPLLILAGHLSSDESRRSLQPLFRDAAELPEEWGGAKFDLARAREILADPAARERDLRIIAVDVFRVQETAETLWDESHAVAMAGGETSTLLRRVVTAFQHMRTEDRERFAEIGEALMAVADLEWEAERQQIELKARA